MKRSEYLMDVVVLRLLLIFLLIFYHAFTIYCGHWEAPYDGFDTHIPAYFWMGYLSHGFRLEAMVFISGLLFGYTISKYPARLCVSSCVGRKIKRLLLPSILFSTIYSLLFYDMSAPLRDIVLKILDGSGHLWFLPMLFWCFVLCYLVAKFIPERWQGVYILLLATLMNIFAIEGIQFGVSRMMTYFVYFYLGFAIRRQFLRFRMLKVWESVLLIALFVAISVYTFYIGDHNTLGLTDRNFATLVNLLHFVGAMCMVFAIYSLANIEGLQEKIKRHDFLITLSGYCYGVFVYHQFVIKFLYYYTPLAHHVSAMLLPWVGIVLTLVISLLLCHFTLRTRFGRFLIG